MSNISNERAAFASKVGAILATAGSAVGLGNIWRFPAITYENGGAAFIFIYILSILLLGLPLMTAEFAVGRRAHTNTSHAFGRLTTNRFWGKVGYVGVFTGWFILCYYVMLAGWTLDYLVDAVLGTFQELAATNDSGKGAYKVYEEYFNNFTTNPWMPIVYLAIFVVVTHFVISRGVKKGIEGMSKLLMPMLFILILGLAIMSLFTDGAAQGLEFMFKPNFSQVTFNTALQALGQAFFSLSIGMGCLCTYASYFSKDTRLLGTATKIAGIDFMVAIMAGIVIFPAICPSLAEISQELNLSASEVPSGKELVFVALPNVFQQAFGTMPLVGYVVSIMFYFLLVVATFTTVISLHEVPTAYLMDGFKMSRKKASLVVTMVCLLVGALCSLSLGVLHDVTPIVGKTLFDCFDDFANLILLPLSGMLITLFVGWKLKREILYDELSNGGQLRSRIYKVIAFLLQYIIPLVILVIFIMGIIDWVQAVIPDAAKA